MKKRKIILAIVAALLIILSIITYLYRDYINVYLANREIEADGVKLLMSGDEVGKIFHEKYNPKDTSPRYCFYTFSRHSLIVDVMKKGRYKDMVVAFNTKEKAHRILKIKIGDKLDYAVIMLKKQRFKIYESYKETDHIMASRGNIVIEVNTMGIDRTTIKEIVVFISPNGSEPK